MRILLFILIWLCMLLPGFSYEIPPESLDSMIDRTGEYLFFDETFTERPSVALVLSGGGAHGFAHVGAIRVLEEAGIPIDLVIGTSMGAIVGTLYSVGYSPADMEEISELTDWRQIFSAPSGVIPYMTMPIFDSRYNILSFYFDSRGIGRSLGFLHDQQIVAQLSRLTHKISPVRNFDELPIPLRIVGADLLTGKAVAFDGGPLHAPMRGTMAIPGLFSPHYIDGRYIIDGGTIDNLPVVLARLMGADIVIAVRAMAEWRDNIDDFSSAMTVIAQAGQIAITNPLINEAEISDLFIDVNFPEAAVMEFWKHGDFIAIGEQIAREMAEEIEQLAKSIGERRELDPRDPDRKGTYAQRESPVISGVEIAPSLSVDDFPVELFQEVVGRKMDTQQIEHIADRLVSSRRYESIGYSVREENGEYYLSLYPIILSRGKHYFGATFFFDGSYVYGFEDPWNIKTGFSVDLVISELIGRGSYLAVNLEVEESLHTNVRFTIPLTSRIYVEPFVSFGEKGYLTQDETIRAVYLEVGQEAGVQLRPYSRAGITLFLSGAWSGDTGEGDVQLMASPRIDIQSYEPSRFPPGGLRCRARLDVPILPDDSWYHRFALEVKHFFPIYRNGIFGWDLTMGSSGYEGPDEFKDLLGGRTELGGWDAVPGYTPNTLAYPDAVMGGVSFSHRFPALSGILEMDIFGISQVRAGLGWDDMYKAWDERSFYGGAALGIGVDSLLGELVVGAGVNLEGNVGFYLLLN